MTREDMHEAVDRLFDKLDAEGRDAIGGALAVPHIGEREGLDYTTTETAIETLHHPRCITPLAGAVHALSLAVDRLAVTTFESA